MGTHLRVLSKSYPMNTNMIGLGFQRIDLCVLVPWMKVALSSIERVNSYIVKYAWWYVSYTIPQSCIAIYSKIKEAISSCWARRNNNHSPHGSAMVSRESQEAWGKLPSSPWLMKTQADSTAICWCCSASLVLRPPPLLGVKEVWCLSQPIEASTVYRSCSLKLMLCTDYSSSVSPLRIYSKLNRDWA